MLILGGAGFQSGDEHFGYLLVSRLREEQGDVDVDALFKKLPDCRDAFFGARHFDHDIGTIHHLPQTPRFIEGFLHFESQRRGYFQADVPVAMAAFVVDRAENIGGILDVAHRDFFVKLCGVQLLGIGRI